MNDSPHQRPPRRRRRPPRQLDHEQRPDRNREYPPRGEQRPEANKSWQGRLWEILEPARPHDTSSRYADWFLGALIVLNILAVILASVDSINAEWSAGLLAFKRFSILVFTVEYLGRLWSCVREPKFAGVIRGRLRYARTPMALVDLLAILPAFLPMMGIDLRVLRGLRLVQFFRIFKTSRHSAALPTILRVVHKKREELGICAMFMTALLFIAATLVFHFEHAIQPAQFPDIPAALWWAISTLTTVGYGDVVPLTLGGKMAAGLSMILGIAFFALPTSILGAGFMEELRHRSEPRRKCPRCGHHS